MGSELTETAENTDWKIVEAYGTYNIGNVRVIEGCLAEYELVDSQVGRKEPPERGHHLEKSTYG